MDCTNIIGEKIKSLRTNQEISIQELAERAGLTVEQVSRIEENIDIPSLAPLIKIARALGVRLGTFLDDQTSEAGPVICRKGEADDTIGIFKQRYACPPAHALSFIVKKQGGPSHGTVHHRHRRQRRKRLLSVGT